jgi:hypothetical protein
MSRFVKRVILGRNKKRMPLGGSPIECKQEGELLKLM